MRRMAGSREKHSALILDMQDNLILCYHPGMEKKPVLIRLNPDLHASAKAGAAKAKESLDSYYDRVIREGLKAIKRL